MANTTNNSARGVHVAPGIYTKEIDLTYASKSLGITSVGVVGETLKGPAFQPTLVENWREYQSLFGGTSTEKFKGSQYPKYELPYIAKEYLKESDNLQVCRVLGLSGVNAGNAWIISAYDDTSNGSLNYTKNTPVVIAVLRSRGEHKKAAYVSDANPDEGICNPVYEYDGVYYYASNVQIRPSAELALDNGCTPGYKASTGELTINSNNYGTFTLVVTLNGETDSEGEPITKSYAVTLNPGDKNYILNVLGTDPLNGDCEIYVEELYDVALQQLIEVGEINTLAEFTVDENVPATEVTPIDLCQYPNVKIIPAHKPVDDLLLADESTLSRKDVGKRYLYCDESINTEASTTENPVWLQVHVSTDKGKNWTAANGIDGHIYTVVSYTDTEGTRHYYYGEYQGTDGSDIDEKNYKTEYLSADSGVGTKKVDESTDKTTYDCNYKGAPASSLTICENVFQDCVMVNSLGIYYTMVNEKKDESSESTAIAQPVTLDLNNYKEPFREAVTPWIVSEMKGDANNVELTKLFRFHTISDGDTSNTEVKVSIEKIDPDEGTFTVTVRGFYDTDGSQQILERYGQCDLVPGSSNYIALKIGSTNGDYETKSNYITVEVNETEKTRLSIPAGFLGYPVRCYSQGITVNGAEMTLGDSSGDSTPILQPPYFKYNLNVDDDIRINRQYFGISNLTGVDEDILKYKGVEAYNDIPSGLSPCFHLDSRILSGVPVNGVITEDGISQVVTVDGVSGYSWSTVGKGNTTEYGEEPRIGSEADMADTIYEDIRYRKFTVVFYGGWDGWDYYRTQRSNGDDYTHLKYRGSINTTSGQGGNFSILSDVENYGFDEGDKCLNSDYYAYLAGAKMLGNPNQVDINVLATPGIDYVNQNSLVGEIIDMVENDRADSIYVVTTPDKPSGSSDAESEMYTPSDAVYNLEDADIDSNYTCTYYPWNKYYDDDNNQYIYLPLTKDVVRNFAQTDNQAYPWFAAAGWNRGTINGVRPKKSLKVADQDTLYDGRINYINMFAQDGMRVWGDKNLQVADSKMNRISHRRLLLRIRKLLSIACIGLLFDPNDATMKSTFESTVRPILEDIVAKRGLEDFRIEVDDSQEARDRLELPAKIYLKLIDMLEYIDISFIITPNGTVWDNE